MNARLACYRSWLLLVALWIAGLAAGFVLPPRRAFAELEERPVELLVEPARVVLTGPRARQQLLVTGRYGTDEAGRSELRDLTRESSFISESVEVAGVSAAGVAAARGNGTAWIVVRAGGLEARVVVRVSGCSHRASVSFRREVVAVLTRAGCNAGTCHGTPTGKNGFRLSLRGYDPELDYRTLAREVGTRRLDRVDPARSLFLLKATAQIAHQGGRRFDEKSQPYGLLHDWVREGALDDAARAPEPIELRVFPQQRVLHRPAWSQQIAVLARFADGTAADVTHLARYSVNDEESASVSRGGLVEGKKRGEVAVSVEYLDLMQAARLTFVEDVPGLVWDEPPANNYIDGHVFAKLRLLRIPPSPLSSAEEFLRRAYLDLLGVLPSPDEARWFLADTREDKRSRLIGELLERPDFAEFWGMRWADRLGCNQRFVGKRGAYKYQQWVTSAMAVNMPEDRFVRAILTATGGNYSSPPAGFYRRLRDPQTAVEEVSQLFMGLRVQCARCHNHPADRWTQEDYYGLAAFFTQVRFKDGPYFDHKYNKEETVYVDRRADELKDPRSGKSVAPRYLDGSEPESVPGGDRRRAFARWLTSPSNPYFARAAVNRVWYHLFGRGIVEPVDGFSSANPPSNAALLDALAADFIDHHFDRKYLIRTIMTSRTYQLSSRSNAFNAGDDTYFSHARVRLLGAEQLLDAISYAAGVPERFSGLPLGYRAAQLPDGEYQHRFLAAFGRPARAMTCECERDSDSNLAQALHLVGGETVHEKIRADDGRVARLIASGATADAIVEELFLATLSRYPGEDEHRAMAERLHSAADRRRAAEDLLWALINHREFLFQH